MPGWLTNPWLHAIVITPVMFYCAAPIHHRGLPALQRRHPNGDSLVSLGMAIVYAYSLLLCVVSWIFPAARAIRISRSSACRDAFAGWHACPATRDDRAADGRNRKGAIGTVNRINRIGAISSEIP